MTESEMLEKLKKTQKKRRVIHTPGVVDEAERLAVKFGVDKEKARLAALLHDCAKNLDEKTGKSLFELCDDYGVCLDEYAKKEKALVHAFLGAAVAKKDFGVDDEEVLSAIYYHTTGKPDMTPLEKIIYIADMTEQGRTLSQSVEIRRRLEKDCDEALIYAIACSIKHVADIGSLIHPDSIHAFNYLVCRGRNA